MLKQSIQLSIREDKMAINLGSNKGAFKKDANGNIIPNRRETKVNKNAVGTEANRVRNSTPPTRAEFQAALSFAQNLSVNLSNGNFGAVVGQVKSVVEQATPTVQQNAKNQKNSKKNTGKRKKASPAMAQLKDDLENYVKFAEKIITQPAAKSSIDTLAGSTTASSVNLKKNTSDNSLDALTKSLENLGVDGNQVRQEVNAVGEAAREDPILQEALTNFFPPEIKDQMNAQLVSDAPAVTKEDKPAKVAKSQEDFSKSLNKELGNPFGSNNSPFGQIGLDFGNILGSVTGNAAGQGSFQLPGQELKLTSDGIDPLTAAPAPPIVNSFGDTQLSKTVAKNDIIAAQESTIEVQDLSKAEEPTTITNFTYDRIVDKKSLELMIQSVTSRSIDNMIVAWTKGYSNRNRTARQYNETILKKERYSSFENKVTDTCAQTHVYIEKNGTASVILPFRFKPRSIINREGYRTIETVAGVSQTATSLIGSKQDVYDEALVVQFEAGFVATKEETLEAIADEKLTTLDQQVAIAILAVNASTITAEQWKTFDMIAEIMARLTPGGTMISQADLHEDIANQADGWSFQKFATLGAGFDVNEYVEKFR